MDLGLQGRRAVVTGASRGIGKATALRLAEEGADVALVARTPEPLRAAAEDIAARTGRRTLDIPTDTGDDDAVRAMVEQVVAELGGVDILVNAASATGADVPFRLDELSAEPIFDDLNIKTVGYLRCIREVVPHMRAAGWGRIISLGGMSARNATNIVSGIRNVSVVVMTKNLADQLGPDGINVTAVHPGRTVTERTPEVLEGIARASGKTAEQVRADFDGRNSIRRMIDAEEVADVITFLASPRAVAINGDVIAAGGGYTGAIHY